MVISLNRFAQGFAWGYCPMGGPAGFRWHPWAPATCVVGRWERRVTPETKIYWATGETTTGDGEVHRPSDTAGARKHQRHFWKADPI